MAFSLIFYILILTIKEEKTEIVYEQKIPPIQTVHEQEIPPIQINYARICGTSSIKTYMDYKKITDKSSVQYKFIKNNMKIKDGFLYYGEYIGVALGSKFGKIGTKYSVTLDTGVKFKVIKIDEKADIHTNNGCQQKWDGSIIEFVIDDNTTKVWLGSNGYYANGNFNNLKEFKGNIQQMYLED